MKTHNEYGKKSFLNKMGLELEQTLGMGVWDLEDFLDERNFIMMKLSDAKECTFQPKLTLGKDVHGEEPGRESRVNDGEYPHRSIKPQVNRHLDKLNKITEWVFGAET